MKKLLAIVLLAGILFAGDALSTAEDINTERSVLKELSMHENEDVRMAVALNDSTATTVLCAMAKHDKAVMIKMEAFTMLDKKGAAGRC